MSKHAGSSPVEHQRDLSNGRRGRGPGSQRRRRGPRIRVGLTLAPEQIVAVEIRRTKYGPRAGRIFARAVDAPDESGGWPGLAKALQELRDMLGTDRVRAALTIEYPLAHVRSLELPPLRWKSLDRLVRRNPNRYFPVGIGPAVVAITRRPWRRGSSGPRPVLATGARSQVVEDVLTTTETAGLHSEIVSAGQVAIVAGVRRLEPRLRKGTAALVLLHPDRVVVLFLRRGRLVLARMLPRAALGARGGPDARGERRGVERQATEQPRGAQPRRSPDGGGGWRTAQPDGHTTHSDRRSERQPESDGPEQEGAKANTADDGSPEKGGAERIHDRADKRKRTYPPPCPEHMPALARAIRRVLTETAGLHGIAVDRLAIVGDMGHEATLASALERPRSTEVSEGNRDPGSLNQPATVQGGVKVITNSRLASLPPSALAAFGSALIGPDTPPLLPEARRVRVQRAARRRSVLFVAIATLCLAAAGGLRMFDARRDVAATVRQRGAIRPAVEQALRARTTIQAIRARVSVLQRIGAERKRWTSVFAALAEALPEDAHLLGLYGDREGFRLHVRATSAAAVVPAVQASPRFTAARLEGAVEQNEIGGALERFYVTVVPAFERPASATRSASGSFSGTGARYGPKRD